MQSTDGVSKDECGKDIEWCLLGHPQQCGKGYLPRVFLENLDDGRLLDFLFIQELLEYWRLKDAKANP
jgi:hypothetical protein